MKLFERYDKSDLNDKKFTDAIKGKVVESFIMDRYGMAVSFTDGTSVACDIQGLGDNIRIEAEVSTATHDVLFKSDI